MGLFRRDPQKAAQAEIANLTTRRDGVLKRLANASAKADAAAAEQRRLLIETDTPDAAALRRAGEACRRAQDDKAALEDAARTLAQQIAEAEAALAAEQERVQGEERAAAIDATAAALAACIADEERAVRALAQAHQATRLAAYSALTDTGPEIDATSLIGELKAVALHLAYPFEYTVAPFSRSRGAPCTSLTEAASTYLDRLRSEAGTIRDGRKALPASATIIDAEVA